MTDLTLTLFDNEISRAARAIDELQQQAERLASQLARVRAELERQEAHRRTLELHRALLVGEHSPLAPEHISSDEDVLGLRIGPMLLCPPGDAGVADLRLHAETMRALYEQAIHQARIAEDAVAAMTTPATAPPAGPDGDPDGDSGPDGEDESAAQDVPPQYAEDAAGKVLTARDQAALAREEASALTVRLARAERERDAAREQVARVRQLHRQVCSGACGLPDGCECADTLTICDTCHEMWPCPTISTIDEEADRG